MKSYTDIEQSKKLAEFLPHETADLWYAERYEGHVELNCAGGKYVVAEEPHYYPSLTKPSEDNWSQDVIKDIPCWSLAALLDLLPYPQLSKDNLGNGKYYGWMVSVYPDNCRYDSCWHDNAIDACYEMIIKLNEQKLL